MKPIDVTENLPEDNQRILWWHIEGRWYIGIYREGSKFHFGPEYFFREKAATHWMPEPPPPTPPEGGEDGIL